MSGHSKWSTIKRKKGAADAKRGKLFSKLIREITVAAKQGGGNADSNPRLRLAIDKAKGANMPNDNVDRAIKKGTGELGGSNNFDEYCMEGYGPEGVAVLAEIMTDNRNRTTAEVRKIFSKAGGSLGESGCVAWQFNKQGLIVIDASSTSEEVLMDIALEAGAEDIKESDGSFEVFTPVDAFSEVKNVLEKKALAIQFAEVSMIPQNTVKLTGKPAEHMLNMMEALEDHDDVQNVYANFDIDESEMEARES